METPIRILVVDDEPKLAQGTARVLAQNGYATKVALSGAEALQLMPGYRPHLVLLDRAMAEIDGTEVCRRIKSDPTLGDVMVIFLSGRLIEKDDQVESLTLGADGYLVRPISNAELKARITAFVRTLSLQLTLREKNAELAQANQALQREVAERIQSETALRERENLFTGVFELSNVGKSLTQPSGEVRVNRAFAEMLGYTLIEMEQQTWQSLSHPDDLNLTITAVQPLVDGRTDSARFCKRYLHKNGSVVWADVSTTVRRDQAGRPLYFMTAAIDITARKQAEEQARQMLAEMTESRQVLLSAIEDLKRTEAEKETLLARAQVSRRTMLSVVEDQRRSEKALRQSEQWFRSAVQDSPFPTVLHAEDGAILNLSNSWCELSGYSPAEIATIADWTERAYGEDKERVRAAVAATFGLEQRKHEGDYAIRTKSGASRIWEFSSAPLGQLPDGRRLVISMAIDVTERRAVEREVQRLNAELETRVTERTSQLKVANQELESFSYSVSHDLRAPLRHVQGYADMLARETQGQLSATGQRYMKTMSAACQEMGNLIDDLLSFSRMGRAELTEASVDLTALVQATVDELARAARGRPIEWSIAPLPTVRADPAMLRLALINLLANAVKFTRPRAPARIEIATAGMEGPRVIIRIRDNGVGFDPHYAHKLFGVFQRLHRADQFEGTGIGLANVRRIITRHGGRTWAEGTLEAGASFFITLQLIPTNAPVG